MNYIIPLDHGTYNKKELAYSEYAVAPDVSVSKGPEYRRAKILPVNLNKIFRLCCTPYSSRIFGLIEG